MLTASLLFAFKLRKEVITVFIALVLKALNVPLT